MNVLVANGGGAMNKKNKKPLVICKKGSKPKNKPLNWAVIAYLYGR